MQSFRTPIQNYKAITDIRNILLHYRYVITIDSTNAAQHIRLTINIFTTLEVVLYDFLHNCIHPQLFSRFQQRSVMDTVQLSKNHKKET